MTLKVTAVFDTKDAGEDKTVSLTYELEDSTGNYKLADTGHQITATTSVTPREIAVSITPNGGVYGGTITPASAVLTGVLEGETVEVTLTYTGTTNDGTVYQSTDVPAKAGTYTVTATITDANYTLKTPNTAEFTVNRADPGLSVSAVPDKDYGDDSFQLDVTQNGDGTLTYESDDTDVLTVDENGQVTIKKAGTAKIRVKVAETANYKEDTKTVEVTVNKVSGSLEVTALSFVKTYGDAPFRITATSTTGTVTYSSSNEEVATVAADGTVTIHNKGMATITVSVPEDENYIAVSKTISVTVMPKAITVKAKEASKIYGDADPELTYEVLNDGLVGNDTLKDIKVEREAGENVKAGGYAISVSGSDANGNYSITFAAGVFTINPRDISNADVTLGDALTENSKEQTQTVVKVVVDGMEVPADAYTVEGNTAKEAGTYTLKIVAKEGSNFTGVRECSYTIAKANNKPVNPPNVPQTGDNSQAPLWITLMLVSICGMADVILVSKKTRNKGKNIK